MNKIEFISKMEEHRGEFDKIWEKIVSDVNKFHELNPDVNINSLPPIRIIDDLALGGAWIEDRINDFDGYFGGATYNKSRSKKIRKALGFTF